MFNYQGGLQERFWSKVDIRGEDECWPWLASTKDHGYGQFYYEGKPKRAHRIAYILVNGSIPDGMEILHACDHPWCVNPGHLKPGTQLDNMNDMDNKGRRRKKLVFKPKKGRPDLRGDNAYGAKLTWEMIDLIRKSNKSQRKLAWDYGVSQSCIYKIKNNKTWIK